jgi:hypothetical protein
LSFVPFFSTAFSKFEEKLPYRVLERNVASAIFIQSYLSYLNPYKDTLLVSLNALFTTY